MNIFSIKWLRRSLLTSIYGLGVLGIVGSGGVDLCSEPEKFPFNCPVSTGPPTPPPPGFSSTVTSVAPALDASDDVYVGGIFQIYNNSNVKFFGRLNNDGSLDTGFVTGRGFSSGVYAVSPAIDGSGDVYVGGLFTEYDLTDAFRIARLNLDGSIDTFFDTGTGFDSKVNIIVPAIDGSGDVYVGGEFTSYNGTTVGSGLIRINDNGSLDSGFITGSGWGESDIALATDTSGDVYVARSSSPGIARLNNDGSIDAVFDTGLSGFNDEVRAIAVATDGSGIYVAGLFSDYNGTVTNGLARLNNDGSLDVGFVTDAGFVSRGAFITPAIDSSGDIYVDSNISGDIVRLKDDGSIDTGFDIGLNGFEDPGPFGSNYPLRSAALATDGSGDVYVGGSFELFNLLPAYYMVRLTSGGVLVR